ncbi:uncharacterized protein LOC133300973 [Gastrolobium bilobum]|uniref:uncharacterized protein LOC133300973 n=1 Tax=Gastrolobium bilobum TaxID=150636 RepID=UPI002AB1327A|nr:uncharacterized protein LOC133300973 [Gastrolobium bilobum]
MMWNAYIQAKKDTTLKNYRTKVFPHFNRLMIIFGKDRATGKNVEAPADVLEDLDEEEETHGNNGIAVLLEGEANLFSDDDIQDVTQSMFVNQNKNKAKDTNSEGRRVRKRSRGEDALATMMGEGVKELVEVVGKSADRMGAMAESVKVMAEGVKVVKDFYDD